MQSDSSPSATVVADEIRGLMAKKHITQTQLADKIGVTQSAIARRLSGRVAFDVNELAAIAAALGVPVSRLLEDVDTEAVS